MGRPKKEPQESLLRARSTQLPWQIISLCEAYRDRTGCPLNVQVCAGLMQLHLSDRFGGEQTAWIRQAIAVRDGKQSVFDAAIEIAELTCKAAEARRDLAKKVLDRARQLNEPDPEPDADGVYAVKKVDLAAERFSAANWEYEAAFQRLHGLSELKKKTLGDIEGLTREWARQDITARQLGDPSARDEFLAVLGAPYAHVEAVDTDQSEDDE